MNDQPEERADPAEAAWWRWFEEQDGFAHGTSGNPIDDMHMAFEAGWRAAREQQAAD